MFFYKITTTLIEPFTPGASCDSAGVGDDVRIVASKKPLDTGCWDEGSHVTRVEVVPPGRKFRGQEERRPAARQGWRWAPNGISQWKEIPL